MPRPQRPAAGSRRSTGGVAWGSGCTSSATTLEPSSISWPLRVL